MKMQRNNPTAFGTSPQEEVGRGKNNVQLHKELVVGLFIGVRNWFL
jgi:hypothetical protein